MFTNLAMQYEEATVSEGCRHTLAVYIDMCRILCKKRHCVTSACLEAIHCMTINSWKSSLHCFPGARFNR